MAEEIRVSRPINQQPVARPEPVPVSEPAVQKSSKAPWIILAVIVVALAAAGILFRDKFAGDRGKTASQASVKPSGYQAVFLTNGQVYFGKISDMQNDYLTLKDIYYLQVVQPPLQGQQQPGQQAAQQQQPQISLIKLGQELHGPVDEMHISRSQVLFYEDLKTEGKVVEAIRSYQSNPQNTAPVK